MQIVSNESDVHIVWRGKAMKRINCNRFLIAFSAAVRVECGFLCVRVPICFENVSAYFRLSCRRRLSRFLSITF